MSALKGFAALTFCALTAAASGRALAIDWSNVWTRPEQRAQRLLDSGHPLEAARLFGDPKRRAYAELQARRYDEAARQLAPFHDVDSEYNRGNALARAGDLPGALASYDAALEQAPDASDVRHNRDLVARALERRSEQQSGGSGMPQQGGTGKQQQGQQSQRSGSQSSSGPGDSGQRAGMPQGQPSGGASAGPGSAGDESEQAKRDAQLAAEMKRRAAAQSRQAQGAKGEQGEKGAQGAKGANGSATGESQANRTGPGQAVDGEWPPPKSEQTLALEQWLRRIPEDPGGLLRRKFLIEHIERHQGTEAEP